jgi:hypothetical protein
MKSLLESWGHEAITAGREEMPERIATHRTARRG